MFIKKLCSYFSGYYSMHTKGVITFLCWLLPVIFLIVYYALRGVYPFGNSTVLTGDLVKQYIDLFKYYKETILYDHTAFTYSFEKSIGGEMLTTWAYYLMSPFNIILLLFPEKLFPLAMCVLIILKVSSSSLTFGYVLQKKFQKSNLATVFFSLSYCLMSYVTAYMSNILWLDGIIWLPLIVYGIERLVTDKNPFMYIISLGILLISNYYIGYMVCIFSVLYFIYVNYTKVILLQGNKYVLLFKDTIRFCFSSMIAALLGSFILLPTLNYLLTNKISNLSIKTNQIWVHNPLDLVYKMLLGSFNYSSVSEIDLPNLFVGSIVSLSFLTFFTNKSINKKDKIGVALLSLILIFSMSISFLDLGWHAFSVPNGFTHRYAFLFSFILCYFGYQSFISRVKYTDKELKFFMCLYFTFALYTFIYVDILNEIGLFCIGISIILFVIFYYFYKVLKDHKNSILLLLFIVLELAINITVNHFYFDFSSNSGYNEIDTEISELFGSLSSKENPESFYRVEKTFNRSLDDSFSFNYKGINTFNSNVDYDFSNLLYKLGSKADIVLVDYSGGTLITDAFLGLNYYVELKEDSNLQSSPNLTIRKRTDIQLYEPILTTDNFILYKNPYALSIGFGINNVFLNDNYKDLNSIELNNELLSAISDEDVSAFTKNSLKYSVGGAEISEDTYRVINNHYLNFRLNSNLVANYIYLPTYGTNKRRIPKWDINESNYVLETTGLILNVDGTKDYSIDLKSKDNVYNLHNYYYTLNKSIFSNAITRVKEHEFTLDTYTNSNITGHTSSTFNRDTLMFTIPYSKDWEVRVDGEVVETKKTYDAFLAIDLSAGEHDIELSYKTAYLGLGFMLSSLSTLGLVISYVLFRKNTMGNKADN